VKKKNFKKPDKRNAASQIRVQYNKHSNGGEKNGDIGLKTCKNKRKILVKKEQKDARYYLQKKIFLNKSRFSKLNHTIYSEKGSRTS
jgi:hypothetical protein